MKIDEFPVEILMQIFNYLPKYDNVFLVNKRFYNVACKVFDPTICLVFNEELLFDKKNLAVLRSIQSTNRQISNINVRFGKRLGATAWKLALAIIKKFSASIKHFSLYAVLELPCFLEMLSMVPNAQHLVFHRVRTYPTEVPPVQKKRRVMASEKDLNFYNLKTLAFTSCDDVFLAVFNRLPDGILTELSFDNNNLNEMNILFKRQTNIKKLTIDWYLKDTMPAIPTDIFDNQQLEYLELKMGNDKQIMNIEIIVSKQKKLKSLKMVDTIVGEKFMNAVVNQLTDLETLLLNISHMPTASLKNIKKNSNLRNLTLQSDDTDLDLTPFEEFAKLDNSRITTLEIHQANNLSADVVKKLAKSVPNLKTLRFKCDYNLNVFNAIMDSFNFVQVLDFGRYDEHEHDQGDNNLMIGDCFNPKLLQLNIVYTLPYKRPFLKKLIANYPNLKKLVFASEVPLTNMQLKLIFEGFKKLESFTLLLGASKLKTIDLKFLKDHKMHLKFVALLDVKKIKFTDQVKNKLRTMFDVVICDDYETIQMAVDRKSMENEKII